MPADHYVPLVGSECQPLPGATQLQPCDPSEQVQVTVVLRPRPLRAGAPSLEQLIAEGKRLSRSQLEQNYGASPKDVKLIRAFALEHGLTVSSVNLSARTVRLDGTVQSAARAFQVELHQYQAGSLIYRGRTGPVYVPENLHGVILGVFGLDNRPRASTHFRVFSNTHSEALQVHAAAVSYTPVQVAHLYDFPSGSNGRGQTIGIIELGGGFKPSDVSTYFSALGISPEPRVSVVSVDGAQNQPTGSSDGPDGEVLLDIEVAGAVAPGARIVVYFAPNTDAGFLDAINQAATDSTNKPSVISISWGGPESTWTAQSLQSYNSALQAAAAIGVTVCVAAGDDGSTDGVTDGQQHVDFPASSPYALACGGTHLVGTGSTITDEEVWDALPSDGATGGGISATFALPTWQANAHVPPSVNPGAFVGRGLPDVAGDADPATGFQVDVDGQNIVIGGTSAVAPLWAGLIACLNAALKTPVGYFNPTLYQQVAGKAGTFRDITSGNNGSYKAGPGWDACTGWGSPNGAAILQALGGASAAEAGRKPPVT